MLFNTLAKLRVLIALDQARAQAMRDRSPAQRPPALGPNPAGSQATAGFKR